MDCLDGLEEDPPKLPLERYRILKEVEELVRLHCRTEWQPAILERLEEVRRGR